MSEETPIKASPEISFDTRDEFNRRPIADKLIKLIQSDIDVSPMIIDGNWGTGKSEFCNKLVKLLKEEGDFQPVKIDAFKADHTDEPFLTILSSILKLVSEDEQPKLIQKIMPAVRFGLKATMKAGVSWVLKQDATDLANDFDSDLKKAGDEIINSSIQTLLSDHIKAEQNLETLTSVLKEISETKPIIIFIDELDRCRPDFAVAVLENIKHIFDIENVYFVLVANTKQLINSINHQYGTELDSREYLEKFVKFSFALPERFHFSQQGIKNASVTYFNNKVRASSNLQGTGVTHQPAQELLEALIISNNLSLRQVETLIKHLEVYEAISDKSLLSTQIIPGYTALSILGVYIHTFEPNLVRELRSGIVDSKAICDLIGIDLRDNNISENLNDSSSHLPSIAWLIHLIDTNYLEKNILKDDLISYLKISSRSLFQQNVPSKEQRVSRITDVFSVLSFE